MVVFGEKFMMEERGMRDFIPWKWQRTPQLFPDCSVKALQRTLTRFVTLPPDRLKVPSRRQVSGMISVSSCSVLLFGFYIVHIETEWKRGCNMALNQTEPLSSFVKTVAKEAQGKR